MLSGKSVKFLRVSVVRFVCLVLLAVSAMLFFFLGGEKTKAQTDKKETEMKEKDIDLFGEMKLPGEKVVPVIHAKMTFEDIVKYERESGKPPEKPENQDKGKRPKNPPPPEMPPAPDSVYKKNPAMYFDYNRIITESPTGLAVVSPTPTSNFQAIDDANTSIPPDTHGAVGPNHLVSTLNTQVRIQSKTGTITSTVTLNSFFSSVGGGSGTFDPRVVYDHLSSRWMLIAVDDAAASTSKLLIAVSQTTDPTGAWNFYGYDYDSTNTEWADYPMVGFNKDWIAVSVNDFTVAANAFSGAHCYVFDKSTLYAGAVTPTVTNFDFGTSVGNVHQPAETFDSTLSTLYILQRWNNSSGQLRIYTITGTAASPSLTATSLFPSTSGWSGTAVFASQSGGGSVTISTNDTRMQSVVYRNGSLWATHTIFMPSSSPTRSAVQWWEVIPSTGTVVQAARIEDTTSTNFYAFPSIAVNAANQAMIGYSAFSATTFASAAYSYRGVTDTSATMRDSHTYKAGVACYRKTFTGSTNRWGDYSHTIVDPSDDTTFWTLQEYAETAVGGDCTTNNTGRWGTWWAKLIPPCTSQVSSGNWNTAATWGCGSVPTSSDDAVIITGQNVTLNTNPSAASITVNSGGTLTMSGNRTASTSIELNGTLNLSSGILDMGSNTLNIGCTGSVTGASSTGYVIGKVTKEFCATGSFTYPVGENGYSPATVNVTTLSTNPSSLTIDVVDSTLSGLNTGNSASRYWDLTGSGITATLSFTYLDADVNGTESAYRVFKKVGAASPTNQCTGSCVNTGTNTGTVTGVTSFSLWGVGSLTPTASSVEVRGQILGTNGEPLKGVMVMLRSVNQDFKLSRLTDAKGRYHFTEIPGGSDCILIPQLSGYTFNPQTQILQLLASQDGINFVGTSSGKETKKKSRVKR